MKVPCSSCKRPIKIHNIVVAALVQDGKPIMCAKCRAKVGAKK